MNGKEGETREKQKKHVEFASANVPLAEGEEEGNRGGNRLLVYGDFFCLWERGEGTSAGGSVDSSFFKSAVHITGTWKKGEKEGERFFVDVGYIQRNSLGKGRGRTTVYRGI